MSFEAGQEVVCIDNTLVEDRLKEGKIYTVADYTPTLIASAVRLVETGPYRYTDTRFRAVDARPSALLSTESPTLANNKQQDKAVDNNKAPVLDTTTYSEYITRPKIRGKLPTDPTARKKIPIGSGVFDYFPDALIAIAEVSQAGNDQHNPGQPLHWAREKSTDHFNCLLRHCIERGQRDSSDGTRESAKIAWRALAMLQLEIEAERMGRQKNNESLQILADKEETGC